MATGFKAESFESADFAATDFVATVAFTGFASAAGLAAGVEVDFLGLLGVGLLSGFLAVATIDSSVVDTALEKLAPHCAIPGRACRNIKTRSNRINP
jgi:hypothetical protein